MLRGLRVLDAGSFIAAPLAAMLLADWGADVVKLEPSAGDAARAIGEQAAPGMSSTFVSCNRGKRSVAIDLRGPAASDTVGRLAATCDIVIHNLPPAAARRLGLDHAALRERRADAVLCTVTAFGEAGPYAGRAALDPIVQAMAGLAAATGEPAGAPMRCAAPVIDTAAGFAAAAAARRALAARLAAAPARQRQLRRARRPGRDSGRAAGVRRVGRPPLARALRRARPRRIGGRSPLRHERRALRAAGRA